MAQLSHDGSTRPRRRRARVLPGLVGLAGLAGCGVVGLDPAATPPVANVTDELPWDGTGALVLTEATIDTTAMTVTGTDLGRAWFEVVAIPGGEAAVLQADVMLLDQVRVVGARPLILAARAELEVRGHLDGSGRGSLPGPGAPTQGPAAGGIGQHSLGDVCDSGGGGGGHALPPAARGGAAPGAAGPVATAWLRCARSVAAGRVVAPSSSAPAPR